ncbi:MAG: tetratricopeptide repeat protein [Henriciella sp.]|nr:tetratricopeptide repeat protein [Hyphomonadaceae bacterium]
MHEQSPFFSAPVLSALALAIAGLTFVAEFVVRSDEDTTIARSISSDDQQEIELVDTTDLSEDYQADLVRLVQDTSLAPLTYDRLQTTPFFRRATDADKPKFAAYVGELLTSRKRFQEAIDVLKGLPPEQRIEHGASFSYALSFRGAGKIDAAIEAYATHLAANPNHNPGYVNYGILLAETGQHEEAIRVFERSVDITSSSRKGKSLSLLGQSQVELARYEEAIDSFDRSIQFRPDSGPTWRRFATAKARSGQYPSEEIEADYERALALSPDSAITMKEWGEFNFSLGRFEAALPLFRNASSEAQNDFDILFSRAVNLLASERPRASRSVIRRMANVEMSAEQEALLLALQEASGVIRPPTLETRDATCAARENRERMTYMCLLLQLETGEIEAANAIATELSPTSIFAQPAAFALARYEYLQGSPEMANERLDVLLTKNPDSPLFWLYKARSLAVAEANEDALLAFARALELNPDSRKTTLEMSDHLLVMEEYQAAEQILTAFVALNPNDAPTLTALARVHETAGNPEQAEETLLQLMEMSEENDAEITAQLVAVQVGLGKYEEALTYTDDLLEQDPANIAVRRLRVTALTEIGDAEEAAAEQDRIQRLLPDAEETASLADEGGDNTSTEFASAAP